MKRYLVFALVCCMLTFPAFAVDWLDYSYINEDGIRVVAINSYNAAVAEEKVAAAGLDLDVDSFWYLDFSGELLFDNDAFNLAYAAALAELQEADESIEEDVIDDPVLDPVDSAVDSNDLDPSVDGDIDSSGDVFSPDDDLFSAGDATALDQDPVSPPLDSEPIDEGISIYDEQDTFPSVYVLSDQRFGSGYSFDILSGLKGLIVSIFGEYTPVLTTMAVTETVDNVTTTTLIDAVAAGAAGVDYEWLAGVFLFGILLYCLMKLLGGLLK